MINYIWVPLLIIVSAVAAFTAKKNNDLGGYWNYLVFITGIFNIFTWILLTKLSRNLIFDSLIYDMVISIVFTTIFVILGCGSKFGIIQWVGTGLVLIGFILMKMGER